MRRASFRSRWQRFWWTVQPVAAGVVGFGSIAALLFMSLLTTGGISPFGPTVTVLDVGTYAARSALDIATTNAATGIVGVNYGEPPPPLTESRTITAKVGAVFGFRFRLEGDTDTVPLTFRVTHPAIDGKTETVCEMDAPTRATHGAFYSIDTEAEAVPGEWVIKVRHKGAVLARERFTTTNKLEAGP